MPQTADASKKPRKLGDWLRLLGPGLITGASDDDPSGISTYSVAGATTGYSMLWLALVTTPMMAVVQQMSARIGMVTGVGLMAVIRKVCPLWLAGIVAAMVIAANTFNVGADIAGMAAAAQLLLKLPPLTWVFVFGIIILVTVVALPYRALADVLKWLCMSLFAYIATAFIVHPPWGDVLKATVIPHIRFNATWLTTIVAVLGTTITPYLFFWQSNLTVEENKEDGRFALMQRRGATARDVRDMRIDVNVGMVFSNVVMFFIIVTCAATLFANHKNIQTAQDAAEALRPLAGNLSYLLFALGMVGTGLLAIPALAGSSAFVAADLFKFPNEGLNEKVQKAPRFYAVIAAGMVVGIAMNVFRVDPIKALFWSAVLNGLAAIPILVVMTFIANDKSIMGKWTNSRLANAWSVVTIVLMSGAAIGMFVFWKQL
jgi:NRAMP (natural resistance-associated macrophage protein)-like metal ion transporter